MTKNTRPEENCSAVLSTGELKTRFKEYNKLLFNNALPLPKFKLTHLRNALALFVYYRPLGGESKQKEIWFNADGIWTDEALKDVLIHEMIHYWLHKNRHNGSRHGIRFRLKCREIRNKYGITVTIRKHIIDIVRP